MPTGPPAPAAFTPAAVLRRVERHGDLLAPALRGRQSIAVALPH
ncbi:MAG TPA: hypothetical protein VGJ77_21555 [Gaiellaceae bacterium]